MPATCSFRLGEAGFAGLSLPFGARQTVTPSAAFLNASIWSKFM
jgi:hypothetical protein